MLVAGTMFLAGCGWTHAPGHDARGEMTKTNLPIILPQSCFRGGCDLAGTGGPIQIAIREAATINGRRDATAFEMTYLGAKSVCRGPAIGPSGVEVPLACTIDAPGRASRHTLVLDPCCTHGALREVDFTRVLQTMSVETDVVRVAGHRAPGLEVTLSNERRILSYSEAHASGVALFTSKGWAPRSSELLAILSLHTFQQLDGTPPRCLTAE